MSLEDGVKIMMDRIELWRNAPVWNESSIAEATRDWLTEQRAEQIKELVQDVLADAEVAGLALDERVLHRIIQR